MYPALPALPYCKRWKAEHGTENEASHLPPGDLEIYWCWVQHHFTVVDRGGRRVLFAVEPVHWNPEQAIGAFLGM